MNHREVKEFGEDLPRHPATVGFAVRLGGGAPTSRRARLAARYARNRRPATPYTRPSAR